MHAPLLLLFSLLAILKNHAMVKVTVFLRYFPTSKTSSSPTFLYLYFLPSVSQGRQTQRFVQWWFSCRGLWPLKHWVHLPSQSSYFYYPHFTWTIITKHTLIYFSRLVLDVKLMTYGHFWTEPTSSQRPHWTPGKLWQFWKSSKLSCSQYRVIMGFLAMLNVMA